MLATARLTSPNKKKRAGWLLLFFAVAGIILAPLPGKDTTPVDRYFRIEARSFEYLPASLHANPGDRITIDLVSSDVTHGIYVDGYNLEVMAEPGQTGRISFTAGQSGAFRMRCSVTCGAMHPFMIGKLYVGTNTLLIKGLGLAVLAVAAGLWSIKS